MPWSRLQACRCQENFMGFGFRVRVGVSDLGVRAWGSGAGEMEFKGLPCRIYVLQTGAAARLKPCARSMGP